MKFTRLFILVIVAALLSACSFSLAADVTPPPGYRPPPTAEPVFPNLAPNVSQGAALFMEKCAPCHGDTGLGDGFRAAQLKDQSIVVPALGTSVVARQATPEQWFTIVTQGNMQKFMPPFSSLSDSQRWDVVAYALSLSTSTETLTQGQAVYAANCARCHGESGQGDGPDAAKLATPATNFTDQKVMTQKSAADLAGVTAQGSTTDMPAFGGKLAEADLWAVTDYLRSFTFAPPSESARAHAQATAQAAPIPETGQTSAPQTTPAVVSSTQGITLTGIITGLLINTSGQPLPADLDVTMHVFDNMTLSFTQTVKLAPSGVYTFSQVEMPIGRVFLTSVSINDATYGSDIAVVEVGKSAYSLPITIFGTTTDQSALTIDRMHLFFDFSKPGFIQAGELYIISNAGHQVVVGAKQGDPVVKFTLPKGATNLQFQDGALGGRYIETPDGFADTVSVSPGSGQYQVLVAFELPYADKLDFSQILGLPAQAVTVLLPDAGVQLTSSLLTEGAPSTVSGATYRTFTSNSVNSDVPLTFSLSGKPKSAAVTPGATSSNTGLVVGLGALGLALVVVGVWMFMRSRASTQELEPVLETAEPEEPDEDADTLMDAVIALDDLYKAGKLPEEAYHERRLELKAKLAKALGNMG